MPAIDKTFNFTKASLTQVILPPKGKSYYYYDTKVPGLILNVQPSGTKSFYLYKKLAGKAAKMYIGPYPNLSVENARKKAADLLGQIANGHNPQNEKSQSRQEQTLGELYIMYMERYSKVHKKSWKYDEREIPKFLSPWFKLKLSALKKADIQELHERIHRENGLVQANRILERIRAMYNKAIEWDWPGTNPTAGIKKYREKARDRFAQPRELQYLIASINEEENTIARDYFKILMLVGTRKTNLLMMRWEEIDWDLKLWRIPDSKNGDPILIPLIDRAITILRERKEQAASEWVFPSDNTNKHYADPKRAWLRIRQRAAIAIWRQEGQIPDDKLAALDIYKQDYRLLNRIFNDTLRDAEAEGRKLSTNIMDVRMHDLRRTLGSYQAITGSSLPIIGQSLGHKSLQSTQIYARLILDPVRESVERAADVMFGSSATVKE